MYVLKSQLCFRYLHNPPASATEAALRKAFHLLRGLQSDIQQDAFTGAPIQQLTQKSPADTVLTDREITLLVQLQKQTDLVIQMQKEMNQIARYIEEAMVA